MRVAAFTKYDRLAASTRQRLLQYVPALEQAGIQVDHFPLLGADYVRSLATGEGYSKRAVVRAYGHRMMQLLRGSSYDVHWIYAELFPYLPASFERLAFRDGRPVVYDFDDAFHHQYDDASHAWVRGLLGGKLEPLLRGAAACCCGNAYLQAYAEKYCERCVILPTVVDTDIYVPGHDSDRPIVPVIGWIGSPSTWAYVRPILPLLEELARTGRATVRIVGAGAKNGVEGMPGMKFVDWSEEREVADVQAMDIGIMPLPDEEWARGKSGYKLVQYMACGLPVVASPVGANRVIVMDGRTGILAASEPEWKSALSQLIDDPALRQKMGAEGRVRAVADYSLATHAPRLVEVFASIAQGGGPGR